MSSEHFLRATPITFPFEPYPSQLVFMERVIEALQESKDALLESPTGTGKTICLLVAALAWRAEQAKIDPNRSVPRLFYASRTHTQLAKVIAELASSPYQPYMTVVGSRKQLCINEKVVAARPATKNALCRSLVSGGKCSQYDEVAPFVARNPHPKQVADIEDLVRDGRANGVCPYYLARERTKTAEITFLPYNYLIDPSVRRMMAESLDGAVLIFDEAHNLDSVCADASSFDVSHAQMTECIASLKVAEKESIVSIDIVTRLERLLSEFQIIAVGGHPGSLLPTAFERAGITMPVAEELSEALEGASPSLTQAGLATGGLQAVISCLRVVFAYPLTLGETPMGVSRHYRLNVSPDRVFSYWCFHPGIALRVLRAQHGVRCVLLASGTLSPMDALASELGSAFPVRLENPHVIRSDQLWAGVVSVGPGSVRMDNSFSNRNNVQHMRDLGMALVNFSRIVPDGLLVFFPSYTVLDVCLNAWQKPGESIWQNLLKNKRIIQEPREQARCNAAMVEFEQKIADGSNKGVLFFAVCRGKVAEGLDFKDRNGRAVVIVGIPFPSATDAKVVAKKRFLDAERRSNPMLLSGDDWYQQQAACAVNQAVGRVIRHRFDYGAMIFLDWRFERLLLDTNKAFLSTWIRPYVKSFAEFGQATLSLTRFFNKAPRIVNELRVNAEEEAKQKRQTMSAIEAPKSKKRTALRDVEPSPAAAAPLQKDGKLLKQRQEKAQRFIGLAKEALGASHSEFRKNLNKYKAKDITVQQVMENCLPLFQAISDQSIRQELLEGFESFLPSKHHTELRRLISSSRVIPLLPSNVVSSVASHRVDRVDPALQEIIRSRAESKAAEAQIIVSRPKNADFSTLSNHPVNNVVEVGSSSPASTPPKSAATCRICLDSFKQPFSANCGHVCCYMCWQTWLAEKLECPVCKMRVRAKQLKKIYF